MEILTVPPEAHGWRLDQYLVGFHGDYSRSYAQKLIKQGVVRVNGLAGKPGYQLSTGETVEVELPAPVTSDVEPESIPLSVLYEDDSLIVVDKPAGMTVHPGAGQSHGTLVNALLAHCERLSGIGGVERPGIVHRIDKGTSGILVVAKTDHAHQDLSVQFRKHTTGRQYVALVCGVPSQAIWTVDTFIGRSSRNRKKMGVVSIGGRRAITHFEVREPFEHFAMLNAQLETGRTHQIRVHLAHCGYSVVGDPVYGGGQRRAQKTAQEPDLKHALAQLTRQALHAEQLAFLHPVTRERMEFSAPLPDDIQAVLSALRS